MLLVSACLSKKIVEVIHVSKTTIPKQMRPGYCPLSKTRDLQALRNFPPTQPRDRQWRFRIFAMAGIPLPLLGMILIVSSLMIASLFSER